MSLPPLPRGGAEGGLWGRLWDEHRKDLAVFLIQVAAWAVPLLMPMLLAWFTTNSWQSTHDMGLMTLHMLHTPVILYFLNFYVLDRWLFQRRRYWLFALANLAVFGWLNWSLVFIRNVAPADLPAIAWASIFVGLFIYFILNCAVVAAALGIRHFIRTRRLRQQLQEEQARRAEAELAWLKNQINPHFLFNTLNNISSLAAIDGDATQEAIAQLSDLLRYAMYETDKPTVPLQGEVDFMRNYVELMKLRYNSMTTVSYQPSVSQGQQEVPPLLFISLIENAFKHGVSSGRPSYIRITLEQTPRELVFDCRNSYYPKAATDRSGSGIGLENTRRRLDLLFPDRYQWEQGLCDNATTYYSHITIQLHDPQLHHH